jgi:hypothetical protein
MPDPRGTRPPSHFHWTDLLILGGAAIVIPVAVMQRRWLFLSVGFALILAVFGRIWLTTWLAKRYGQK